MSPHLSKEVVKKSRDKIRRNDGSLKRFKLFQLGSEYLGVPTSWSDWVNLDLSQGAWVELGLVDLG